MAWMAASVSAYAVKSVRLAWGKIRRAWVRNSTDQLHNLQVQGPKSRDILRQIIWTRPDQATIDELEWFRFSIARIGDEHGIPLVVSRTGYTGELGYEVFCHPKDAPAVYLAAISSCVAP